MTARLLVRLSPGAPSLYQITTLGKLFTHMCLCSHSSIIQVCLSTACRSPQISWDGTHYLLTLTITLTNSVISAGMWSDRYNLVPYRSKGGDAPRLGRLASHWPCVTDTVVYRPTGSTAVCPRWSMAALPFYARKQLLLSARLSHRNSVCPSVCPSHGCINQKRCKLESPNLHHRLPGRL